MRYLVSAVVGFFALFVIPLAGEAQGDGDGSICGWCRERIGMDDEIEHKMSAWGVIVDFCHVGQEPGDCDTDGHDWEDGQCDLHKDCGSGGLGDAELLQELIDDRDVDGVLEFLEQRPRKATFQRFASRIRISHCGAGGAEFYVDVPRWAQAALE